MKYISSKTLEKLLNDPQFKDKWTIYNILNWVFAIINGMTYLHDNLICHGNLCPSNIVIDDANQCYICDFGLYPIKCLYYNQDYMIDKAYKDPFMEDDEPSFKNDVYSFGIIICQLCFSFIKNSNQELFCDFLSKKDITKFNMFPKFFSDLISSCLSPNINERPTFKKIIKLFQSITYSIGKSQINTIYEEFNKSNYIVNLANTGNAYALNKLGKMYENGKEIEKDYSKALKYYKKAALQNFSEAQSNYGLLLQKIAKNCNDKIIKDGVSIINQRNERKTTNGNKEDLQQKSLNCEPKVTNSPASSMNEFSNELNTTTDNINNDFSSDSSRKQKIKSNELLITRNTEHENIISSGLENVQNQNQSQLINKETSIQKKKKSYVKLFDSLLFDPLIFLDDFLE